VAAGANGNAVSGMKSEVEIGGFATVAKGASSVMISSTSMIRSGQGDAAKARSEQEDWKAAVRASNRASSALSAREPPGKWRLATSEPYYYPNFAAILKGRRNLDLLILCTSAALDPVDS